MLREHILGVIVGALFMIGADAFAETTLCLGDPFSDGMVLQREMAVPVWGWAVPGQTVRIEFKGQKKSGVAGRNGKWRVVLDPLDTDATGAILKAYSDGDTVECRDVVVGEVWICSGQSNMAMQLRNVKHAQQHIKGGALPLLRSYRIPVQGHGLAQERLAKPGRWVVSSPETAGDFSAVAFFFGRDLVRELDVPVGLIVVATGATPIERWIPREGLALVPELAERAKQAKQDDNAYRAALDHWEAKGKTGEAPVHADMVKEENMRGLSTFYNGCVAPVTGYGMRGMIWYQGESNRGDTGEHYFSLHKAMLRGWRKVWGEGDFPFYYVQISALDCWRPDWHVPEVWAGQNRVMELPNTGMAVIHDLCEEIKDIHPKNKEGVGRRLALWALARTYGVQGLPYAGPIYRSHTIDGNRVRVLYDYTFGGLKSRDGKPPDWFQVAGADKNFVRAHAEVEGETVVVWSAKVEEPVAIRFAWSEAAQPNLVNSAELPASPFRTDDWAYPEAK